MPYRCDFHVWMLVALLATTAAVGGCDGFGDDDNVVEGVDLDELFAPPSAAEIAAVEREWDDRTIAVVDAEIVHEESLTVAGWSGNVAVVRHRVGAIDHFGAVIVPRLDETRGRPVLVYLHGDDEGISIEGEIDLLLRISTQIRDSFIVVVPSFRSESLRIGGHTFTSAGPPSPWNYDVDDALALLETTNALFPQADEDRIAAIGFSRGSTVAMLMAVRNPRIDGVVAFFGVTDFYGAFVREIVRDALRGRQTSLAGADYLNETVVEPLKSGYLTIVHARPEFTRRSPVYFVDRLPPLQVHHGDSDDVVPVSEAQVLMEAVEAAGAVSSEFHLYPGGTHHPITLNGSLGRASEFLLRVIKEERNLPL